MNRRSRVGKASELIVAGELVRRGVDVYIPCVDDQAIDLIIRSSDNLFPQYYEVQVKSVKGYNRIVGLRGLTEKPPSYLLIIHYRHEKKDDEFFWLMRDQAKPHAIDGEWGDLILVLSRVLCGIIPTQVLKEWKVMAHFPNRV